MQLSARTIEFIANAVKVAKILKIENLVLDHECVRGNLQEEGSMIIQRDDLPEFEFTSMGISRIDTLQTRMSLLGSDVVINVEERVKNPNETVVLKLLLSSKKTEVEFKCADPALMPKAPKKLNDPICFTFDLTEESIGLLTKAQSAMHGETITVVGSKKGVISKLCDTEGDTFNHILAEELSFTPDADKDKFAFSYKNKILIPLLRIAIVEEKLVINITRRGILNIKVNGLNVFITPEQ